MKSWNEIRKAATAFSKRWKDAYDEKSQAQSFLKEFFAVFGVDIVLFNTFEHRVKFGDGSQGYADCFWQGKILVEMKSRGKDLDAAFQQAIDYVRALSDVSQTPRAIVVSDFARIRFYDLANDCALTEFALKDLRKFVTIFGYMIGADERGEIREQDPVNRKAAEQMAKLHDAMKAVGYAGHPLEVYLVRLLFCLFAEDTGIFKPNQFSDFIEQRTSADGSDLAAKLAELFQVLNTPPEKRLSTRDESLAVFPYVNGGLFAEFLPIAAFSPEMRRAILDCGELDWSKISPAIFGAMFQGVMDEKARHDLGAHYTSEENILKLIKPLFLDGLRSELDDICALRGTSRPSRLRAFHEKISSLTFLDPACGCGNFLLIGYRELRHVEMDVLDELHKDDPALVLDVTQLCKVNVSQFYGIEIEPFPAEIAKVALWLMDHLCNMEVADRFGQYFARIPIKDAPHIVCANALTTDWGSLLATKDTKSTKDCFDYIMGNPPFGGKKEQSAEQKAQLRALFSNPKTVGNLDFVAAWYRKASDLIAGTSTRCAFVATNSITQGEQVPLLWQEMAVEINFAYRTFKWHNEAKGVAAVHCVIIGFHAKEKNLAQNQHSGDSETPRTSRTSRETKIIYDSHDKAMLATNINAYLADAPNIFVTSRADCLSDLPEMLYGSMPIDNGHLILSPEDRASILSDYPKAEPFIWAYSGGDEFLNSRERFCLWLLNADSSVWLSIPPIVERVKMVREFRSSSGRSATVKLAATPSLFGEIRQPTTTYLLIPKVSSETRDYIPVGFIPPTVIASGSALIVPNATPYHFALIMSRMQNAWMRAVAGRMKSDYQYSKNIVYNNFIAPSPSAELHEAIAAAGAAVLAAREPFLKTRTLAQLYNPLAMPPDLVKAHAHLDSLVDKAYGLKPTATDSDRVALLFKLYAEKTNMAK